LRSSPYSVKLIYNDKVPKEKMYRITLMDEKENRLEEDNRWSTYFGELIMHYIIRNEPQKIKNHPLFV
jgi:hypothetical protein